MTGSVYFMQVRLALTILLLRFKTVFQHLFLCLQEDPKIPTGSPFDESLSTEVEDVKPRDVVSQMESLDLTESNF